MPAFDQKAFNQFILANDVVGFFEEPVTLKSGRRSNFYVNWRKVASDVYLIDKLSDFLISFAESQNLRPDSFFGVPEGATKLGVITTFKWAKAQKGLKAGSHILPMGRGKIKEHGKPEDRFFLGEPRGRIIIIEDVTTTGGSLIETISQLKQIKAQIIAAISLTNRMEKRNDGKSVADAVAEAGVKYFEMSRATEKGLL